MNRKCILWCFACWFMMLAACGTAPEITPPPEMGPANLNESDEQGMTRLMRASASGNIKEIRSLISEGANVHLKDTQGRSALYYAYESDNITVFKILLENGAQLDFDPNKLADSDSEKKVKMIRLSDEFQLVKQIRNSKGGTPLLFDAYFSQFPEGSYNREMEAFLEQSVKDEYKNISSSPSAARWERFIDKYAGIGTHGRIVTAKSLNIRSNYIMASPVTGKYHEGDRIYSTDEKFGWLKTDKGWVAGQFTQLVTSEPPLLKPYFNEAYRQLDAFKRKPTSTQKTTPIRTKPSSDMKPKPPKKEQAEEVVEKEPVTPIEEKIIIRTVNIENKGGETDPVLKELNDIIGNPSEESLKQFIQKYKDDYAHQEQVETAKDEYKKLILGQ